MNVKTMAAFGAIMTSCLAGLSLAQELAPARVPIDDVVINYAWSQEWDDYLHSGKTVTFTPPALEDIPEGDFGDLVQEGLLAFLNPTEYARPYVGNEMACSNCHLDAGRRAGAAPMWGAYPVYPKYRGKNNQVNTIEMRIQGCFRYSMNGTPPPADSDVIKAYLAYFSWLSQGAPIGASLEGAGFETLPDPALEPSVERGAGVYAQYCVACHGTDGQGQRETVASGWVFPPLWGPESFNWGAGMHDPSMASAFIKKNMPLGLRDTLNDQQAWDVAVYMNSHERPQDPRFNGDVAATAQAYHRGKFDMYGRVVNGAVLGTNAYPSGGSIVLPSIEE